MRRKIANFAAAVTLLLCVAVCVLWVRSYWVSETVEHDNGLRVYEARTGRGSISFAYMVYNRLRPPEQRWMYNQRPPAYPALIADESYWHFSYSNMVGRFAGIIVPYALPAALLGVAPLWRLMSWMGSRGPGVIGGCTVCGYALRAPPDRCPEGGARAKPPHNPPMQRTATASS